MLECKSVGPSLTPSIFEIVMKKRVRSLIAGFALLSSATLPALADTYQLTLGWTDATVWRPTDTPGYEAKYRINAGAEIAITGLKSPGASRTITATPGQAIDVAARTCNGTLCSSWSAWVTAAAPYSPTTPASPSAVTITVSRTGP